MLPYKRLLVVVNSEDRGRATLQIVRVGGNVSARVHFQQAFTGAPFFPAFVGNASCDALRISQTECFGFNDCMSSPMMISFRSPNATYVMAELRVAALSLSNPSCPESTILAAVVVQSDMPFATAPIYRIAAFGTHGLRSVTVVNKGTTQAVNLSLTVPPNETEMPTLTGTAGGTSSVHCSIADVKTFDREEVDITTDLGLRFSSKCDTAFPTGADLQAWCSTDERCMGLTTTASGRPLCHLRSGQSTDPHRGLAGRWLMTKPVASARSCDVLILKSGIVTVLIRQTSLASSKMVVQNGDGVVAVCGGSDPFAGGLFGRSSACGTWIVCYEGHAAANDSMKVVASSATAAGGCDEGSVGVIFSVNFDLSTVTRAPEPRIPLNLSLQNLRDTFQHRLSVSNERRSFLNVFVRNAEQILLVVAQTGFDCTRTRQGTCSRPGLQLKLGSTVVQECGGSKPFLSTISGASDQCRLARICAMPTTITVTNSTATFSTSTVTGSEDIPDSASSLLEDDYPANGVFSSVAPQLFTGWVELSADISLIRSASSVCPYMAATLLVSSRNASLTSRSGFVLAMGKGEFMALAAPRIGTAAANSSSEMTDAVPLPELSQILVGRLLFLINTTNALVNVGSFACIMDWISSDTGVCNIPVPPGVNFVTIRVSQTNFKTNIMTMSQIGSTAETLEKVQCGAALGFSGQPALSEQCAVFLPCGSGFLKLDTATLRLSVPAGVRDSGSCTVAFAATVDFSFVSQTTVPTECPLQCTRDRTCVPLVALCNGIADCSDGSDEENCNAWQEIERSSVFSVTTDCLQFPIAVFSDCRNAALRNGTAVFATTFNQTICILYPSSRTREYLAKPTPYLVDAPSFAMFALLEEGETYGRCTSQQSCSSNGQAVENRIGKLSCTCICKNGFTGSDCSQRLDLSHTGPIVISFREDLSVEFVPSTSAIEASLLLLSNSTETAVTCSPVFSDNGKLSTTCTVSGPSADVETLNAAAAATSNRASLASSLNLSSSSIRELGPATQPLLQHARCVDQTCFLGGVVPGMFRSTVQSSSSSGEIILDVTGKQNRRSTSNRLRCVPENGNVFETPTRSGCVATVCFVPLDDPMPVDTVSITTPSYAGNASSDPCFRKSLEFTVTFLVADVVMEAPVKSDRDYSAFLISGIAVLVVGGVLLGAASFALRLYISESSAAVGVIDSDTALKSLLTIAIRKMKFNHLRNIRTERWSTLLAIGSFDLLVLGIFLALYFANSSSYTSNVEVLLETYRTDRCAESTFAPLPLRVTHVPAEDAFSCVMRESTGVSSGAIYAAAFCDNATGQLSISIKIGSSLSDCEAMPFTRYSADACVRAAPLFTRSLSNNTDYLLFQCGTVKSVRDRFSSFKMLNADDADIDITLPQVTGNSQQQPTATGRVSYFTRVFRGVSAPVSSNHNRFESAANSSDALRGSDDSQERIVLQVEQEVFSEETDGAVTAALELASPVSGISGLVAAYGPQDGDYPVGYLFNNFRRPGEASLFAAGPDAARYYGIQGTAADIGSHYSGLEFEGFTVSMYLRCTRSTAGFAFAVADAREDLTSGLSPLLTRLMAMLANGSPGSAWYNSTYNVYSGLFVDGPAQQLHFVYANAGSLTPIVDLQWDLPKLGLNRLLNGLWHHVAIIIRSENGNTKVQLVVDGQTSESVNGWNQCPDRTPEPVRLLSDREEITVRNFQRERVLRDGVLYTGYFNGGVAHLQFTPEKVSLFDLWRQSTAAIQAHNAIHVERYVILGCALLVIGVCMLCLTILTSGSAWATGERLISELEEREGRTAYAHLWQQRPEDADGSIFPVLPFDVALATVRCNVTTFVTFIGELDANFRDPSVQLVRLLYAKKKAFGVLSDPNIALPTVEEWSNLFGSDLDAAGDLDLLRIVVGSDDGSSLDDEDGENTNPLESSDRRRKKDRASANRGAKLDVKVKRSDIGISGSAKRGVTKGGSNQRQQGSTTARPSELIQTVLGVVQSVSVWQTSMPFPIGHLVTFKAAFATFSLDFTSLVQVSPLVTPLVQLFVGIVVFGVLLFVMEADEKAFLWNLARYVIMRDVRDLGLGSVDAVGQKVSYLSEVDAEFDRMLGEVGDSGLEFGVPVLPIAEAQKVDAFLSGDDRKKLSTERAMFVFDCENRRYSLQKPPAARNNCPPTFLYVKSADTETTNLRTVSHLCIQHTGRWLAPQLQTSVWPYRFRPTCSVIFNGHRCNESVGIMYVCGCVEERHDELVQCKYAVCEQHFRPSLAVALLVPLVGAYRAAMDRGVLWLIATIFLLLANACYTPFMKTALSILACDPYYQCEFRRCWEGPDRLFILAAYLCLVIVVFYGIGFPLCMTFLLHRRKQMLDEIFFSESLNCRYLDPTNPKQVRLEEWTRYVVTDPTALGKLYLSFKPNWIYIPPIMLMWKAIVLAPAVFIERNTFEQILGISIAQFLFGVFLFITESNISPIVDLTYKLGAAHQILLLGLLSINTRQAYAGATDMGAACIALTLTFLAASAVIFLMMTLMPVIRNAFDTRRAKQLCDEFGMHHAKSTGLYITPRPQAFFAGHLELAVVKKGASRAGRNSPSSRRGSDGFSAPPSPTSSPMPSSKLQVPQSNNTDNFESCGAATPAVTQDQSRCTAAPPPFEELKPFEKNRNAAEAVFEPIPTDEMAFSGLQSHPAACTETS